MDFGGKIAFMAFGKGPETIGKIGKHMEEQANKDQL